MKELYMLAGFALGVMGGMVVGTMLYKHCNDTKQLVDEAENCIAKEIDMVGDSVKKMSKKIKKNSSNEKQQKNG